MDKGSSEGRSPFDRALGVSPRCGFHPLPSQEGGRGMVEVAFVTQLECRSSQERG